MKSLTQFMFLIIMGCAILVNGFAADDVEKNSAPMAEVKSADHPVSNSGTAENKGKEIYDAKCAICHGTGIAGSPKLGDKAAWEPRAKQGIDTLLNHAINGMNAMPPRGTCVDCSDDDLKAAIEYMLNQQ